MDSDPSAEDAGAGSAPKEDVASTSSSHSSSSCFVAGSDGSRSSTSSGEVPGESFPVSAPPVGGGAAERRWCVGRIREVAVAAWGLASTVGRRKEMEDAAAVVPEFLIGSTCEGVGGCLAAPGSAGKSDVRFFGVYDGHGGSQVANYCAKRMHEVVADEWLRGYGEEAGWKRRWEVAFSDGFQKVDNELISEAVASDMVGSTAVTVVVSGCQIIACNCGDSRAILCRGNQTIQLTADHKCYEQKGLALLHTHGKFIYYGQWIGKLLTVVLSVGPGIFSISTNVAA